MPTISNSSFLDYSSYGTTTATTVEDAYHVTGTTATHDIAVAFILPRANDPTALLDSNWATRQTMLQSLEANGTLWSTYGADQTAYDNARTILGAHGTIIGNATGSDGYVTSQESRTIWVQLTPTQFENLLGAHPYEAGELYYWNGNLSVPNGLDVAGLWFDTAPWFGTPPAVSDLSGGAVASTHDGAQSIGNYLSLIGQQSNYNPNAIANQLYHFPLTDKQGVPTSTIGLIEPGIGDALPSANPAFGQALAAYRHAVGISSDGSYYEVGNAAGLSYADGNSGERSLDVGVVGAAAPGSKIGLYSGSGFTSLSHANDFTAYQAAFWDRTNEPAVLSSSFSIFQQTRPGSIFADAVNELFIDSVLRNITMVQANTDFGSSWSIATGLANQAINSSSPYMLLVGGTSLATLAAASHDPTLAGEATSLYDLAMHGDLSTLWKLMLGGLSQLPSTASGTVANQNVFLESVWNSYVIGDGTREPKLGASDGGVDTTQDTPWYQKLFGLMPTSVNPGHDTGRGAPDVSAESGGDMFYRTPGKDMLEIGDVEGTSAATPLWASLMAQVDMIFVDQGLPHLGFANDLLYIAAAIAPAAFNDITFGNNVTSFINGGSSPILDADGNPITLTGYGYYAGPGYDLTTGLGSPNGVLLARALTTIAHSQMSFSTSPEMLHADGSGDWTSGVDQSLMFQTMSGHAGIVGIALDASHISFDSTASANYAWTAQLAEQVLQPDFDPNLIRLFDKQAQGWVQQSTVGAGDGLAVSLGGKAMQAGQGAMTSAFGFTDFMSDQGVVRVARPVAVAETADHANDTTAILRVRQDGEDSLSLSLYKVDDFDGTIKGVQPGQAGYDALAAARAYQLTTGGTALAGPGYGNYAEAGLEHVDAGDLIAMKLVDNTSGAVFWAFASANETGTNAAGATEHVGHLWNYGANTWGWEDQVGGGDRDFNDLIVQLDFTSNAGHGWLA